jgi:hypothetical protein
MVTRIELSCAVFSAVAVSTLEVTELRRDLRYQGTEQTVALIVKPSAD